MTDRPILFSGPMVRALLAGHKTQTRRVLTPRNSLFNGRSWSKWEKAQRFDWERAWIDAGPSPAGNAGPYLKLPYAGPDSDLAGTVDRIYPVIHPGDRLWVRESVTRFDKGTCDQHVWYAAGRNDVYPWLDKHCPGLNPDAPWPHPEGPAGGAPYAVPSIHMPRWASRLTLSVSEIRVQRLQEISEPDAVAESCKGVLGPNPDFPDEWDPTPVEEYRELWDSLNADRGYGWDANPWVIAITFTVARGKIGEARP